MAGGTIYQCSDGRYYGDADVWERFESGTWSPCCWDAESGNEWVRTADDELLLLEPTPPATVPPHVEVERVAEGISVSDPRAVVQHR